MYDVIVVGAGPAGAYSAYLCAKQGLDTLLLEKERTPRRKCCAGGVLERALKLLDFPIPPEIVEREVSGAAVIAEGHRHELRFGERMAITVRRERFDRFLVEQARKAGASYLEEEKVVQVKESVPQVDVVAGSRYQGRCLIVADGVGSKLAEGLMGPYTKSRYAAGMSFNCGLERDPDDLMEFYFYKGERSKGISPPLYGYGWMFPCRMGANLGAGGAGFNRSMIQERISEIERSAVERYGKVTWREELAGHPLPLFVRSRLHSSLSMAVGDAGGLANPITGEGLTYAFTSAALAASSAALLVKERDDDATAQYERRCRAKLVRDLDAARLTQKAVRGLLGTLDLTRFFDAFCESEELKTACKGIAQGGADWKGLLRKALPRVPALYFSSL
ncbi:MAG: NAD(P)/FAD-dependent oxidoreductase [Methanomassiliicoccales archaeon]|nr:NAD(P)/FAD-dependent oxidoreductase [Methanomassiliicoccales archaeon]MDD1756417.1 NAD(P)/FAD-dependent oxidoreductase [Methanomassiliicoccales archaeon]